MTNIIIISQINICHNPFTCVNILNNLPSNPVFKRPLDTLYSFQITFSEPYQSNEAKNAADSRMKMKKKQLYFKVPFISTTPFFP